MGARLAYNQLYLIFISGFVHLLINKEACKLWKFRVLYQESAIVPALIIVYVIILFPFRQADRQKFSENAFQVQQVEKSRIRHRDVGLVSVYVCVCAHFYYFAHA